MATGLSAWSDQSVLYTILGFASGGYGVPAGCYISLHDGAIGNPKVPVSEWVNGGALNTHYTARIAAGTTTGLDSANWTITAFAAGTGVIAKNTNQVQFAALTGTGNNILSVGFWDSATIGSGNMDWFADVASQAVAPGIIVAFFSGDISFTLL